MPEEKKKPKIMTVAEVVKKSLSQVKSVKKEVVESNKHKI